MKKKLYICDNHFHTEYLQQLLVNNEKYGFIIIDGMGCLFATLSGDVKTIIHKFSVTLPKKHGRGGQSALRFARLRLEARRNYIRKVAESAKQFYIGKDNKINVRGLILAGNADLKNELNGSSLFDGRLKNNVVKIIDTSYGMESGLNQAIDSSFEIMRDLKFIKEKKVISSFFNEIAKDTGKFCYSINDTMDCLEQGAVEKLIVWENLPLTRYKMYNPVTDSEDIIFLTEKQENDPLTFLKNGISLETREKDNFVEWLIENYKSFGTTLQFISDKSQEGSQFCKGFGGIGGMLRWKVDLVGCKNYENYEDDDDFFI